MGIVVGGGLVMLAVWLLSSGIDVVASLVLGLLGLLILIASLVAVGRWRRNLRTVAGDDGVVFAVDQHGLRLGAFGLLPWGVIRKIVFEDRRTADGVGTGTAAGYGRTLGYRLRIRGGKSEMDVLVARRDDTVTPNGVSSEMLHRTGDDILVRLPFGSALPVEAFHDAYRAVEPIAVAHGAALLYDNKASV